MSLAHGLGRPLGHSPAGATVRNGRKQSRNLGQGAVGVKERASHRAIRCRQRAGCNLHDVFTPRRSCLRCHKPTVGCTCAAIRPVFNRTPVVVFQHPRERRHPLNTARIAKLGLRRATLHVAFRGQGREVLCPPIAPPGAALLFPSAQARVLEPSMDDPPSSLVVVDGTWPTARRLIRDNPWLQALPRVSLRPQQPGRYRIRKARHPHVQLSTIEAIVAALQILEPDTPDLEGLLEAFDAMIDRQIELAGDRPRYMPASASP